MQYQIQKEALALLEGRGELLETARALSRLMQRNGVKGAVIGGTTTVALEELIEMKLRSGTSDPLRAQDLADVIGLIRVHDLSSRFATKIAPSLRPEFRRLVQAIRKSR